MNLKDLLAKKPSELNEAEKAFIREHAAELSDAEKSAFASILTDEDKGLDVEAVKNLVSKSISEALEKKVDQISDEIVAKFTKGAAAQRQKAIDTGEKKVDANRDVTRSFLKALMDGDKVAAKALSTSESGSAPNDAQAGLLIPVELRNEVLRVAQTQFGLARRDMMYLPFSGPGNSRMIPTLGTSVRVFWTGEKGKKTSTQPKFSLVEQTLKKLAAIVPMTEEILEDSAINLTQLLGQLFAEAIAKEEDLQFFAGTGSPWTGLLNNGSIPSVTLTGGVAAMTADDLLDLQDKVPSGSKAGGKYYLNSTVLSVLRKFKGNDNQYIWQGPKDGQPGTIWNKPYEESDVFPTVSEIGDGDAFVLFGNLKTTCVFGDKQQIRVKLLEEATVSETEDESGDAGEINLAQQDMVALRIVERVGYVCAMPAGLAKLVDGGESP